MVLCYAEMVLFGNEVGWCYSIRPSCSKDIRPARYTFCSCQHLLGHRRSKAVQEFQDAMPKTWNLFLDQFYVEMLPYRVDEYNGSPKMAKRLGGRAGLVGLGSLLVAMEANDFVLTTASNWSRLMNELRKSILNTRCKNCTTMIDLRGMHEW